MLKTFLWEKYFQNDSRPIRQIWVIKECYIYPYWGTYQLLTLRLTPSAPKSSLLTLSSRSWPSLSATVETSTMTFDNWEWRSASSALFRGKSGLLIRTSISSNFVWAWKKKLFCFWYCVVAGAIIIIQTFIYFFFFHLFVRIKGSSGQWWPKCVTVQFLWIRQIQAPRIPVSFWWDLLTI